MSTRVEERTAPAEAASVPSGRLMTANVQNVLALLFLAAGCVLFIAPFFWMLSTSLKPAQQIFDTNWIPKPVQWSNYRDALTSAPFLTYFKNSVIVTGLSSLGGVLSASLVAYSFARLRWPGRDLWFGIVLATMMLPGIVTLVPTYVLFAKLHWVNTFLPLIVPAWLGGTPFWIFLLRQFYRGIPMELSEAARIDGASELRIWWQIIMPLSRPVLTAVAIFAFNGAWSDYMKPLIYLSDERKYTLQLGLTTFQAGGGGVPLWHWMMAASLVVMLPVVIVFFFGQRYFIEGQTLTGLSGR